MDVTPQELRGSEIKDAWRGYDRDEVDDLLERAAVTIESLSQKLQEAASRPAPSGPSELPLPSSREDADMLQRTLLLAQRAADEAVNEAQARARQLLDESEAKAQGLVSEAEATARRIAEGERRRLEAEIDELATRREQLRGDADALEEFVSGYRDRLRAAIEADLASLAGDVEPPSSRPELHDVVLPSRREPAYDVTEVVSTTPEPAAAPEPSPSPLIDAREVPRPSGPELSSESHPFDAPPAASAAASRAPVAAPPRPSTEWPPAPAAGAANESWLAADDDWSSDAAWDAQPSWAQDTAHHDIFASDEPMEANAVDTDSLDDDAFFASLREAVRDEAPLGPRDEQTYYEEPVEQDRRRFRRRR
jgi:DivIVA domain-containing protein